MRHVLTLEENDHQIWLARHGNGYALEFDGKSVPVALQPGRDDFHQLTIGTRTFTIALAVDGDRVHVHLDGASHEIVLRDPVKMFANQAASVAANVAIAPMPGRVIATPVSAGDGVAVGDVLVIIESMKLETAIKAQRAGTVEKVHLEVGQTFERDATLVSLVPLGEG